LDLFLSLDGSLILVFLVYWYVILILFYFSWIRLSSSCGIREGVGLTGRGLSRRCYDDTVITIFFYCFTLELFYFYVVWCYPWV